MFEIVPFKAEHIEGLIKQNINKSAAPFFQSSKALEECDSVTVLYKGKVVVCGGIIPYWNGRGQIWAMFSETLRENFLPAFRAIKGWVRDQVNTKYHRLELSVDYEFDLGKRRAELLGFTLECERARKFLPTQGDCSLYSMVRE